MSIKNSAVFSSVDSNWGVLQNAQMSNTFFVKNDEKYFATFVDNQCEFFYNGGRIKRNAFSEIQTRKNKEIEL